MSRRAIYGRLMLLYCLLTEKIINRIEQIAMIKNLFQFPTRLCFMTRAWVESELQGIVCKFFQTFAYSSQFQFVVEEVVR